MVQDLFSLGLISVKEVSFYPSVGCEFYITLGRSGQGVNKSRLELLEIIESEIKDDKVLNERLLIIISEFKNIIKRITRRTAGGWDSSR